MSAPLFKTLLAQCLILWARNYIVAKTRPIPPPEDSHLTHECWMWTRGGDGRYGHAYLGGKRIKAHILSFLAHGGRLTRTRSKVDHLCSRGMCCQPRHLDRASQSENIKRCFARGRGKSPFIKGRSNGDGTRIAGASEGADPTPAVD